MRALRRVNPALYARRCSSSRAGALHSSVMMDHEVFANTVLAGQQRDVYGERIVLRYPRCSEAPSSSTYGVEDQRDWRQVLNAGPPASLSEGEARQWRQEVKELHTIDEAVAEYRERYAQVENRNKLAPTELLDRRMTQREIVSAGWFTKLAARLRSDLVDWASGEAPRVSEVRKRSQLPMAAFGALVTGSSSGPRDVALEALRRELTRYTAETAGCAEAASGGATSPPSSSAAAAEGSALVIRATKSENVAAARRPEARAAMRAAESRVRALPRDAKPAQVRRALELVGPSGSPSAQTERAMLQKLLKQQGGAGGGSAKRTRRRAEETVAAPKGASATAGAAAPSAEPSIEPRLPGDLHARWAAEQQLLASYDTLLPKRLEELAEHLSAITLNHVTSRREPSPEHRRRRTVAS